MIPIAIPNLCGKEAEYLQQCVTTGMVSTIGPFVSQFEEILADTCQAGGAVATSSGTTALHSALLTLGIGRDDLVVTPSFSFIASANAISHASAEPWFFDVEETSWTMDPQKVSEHLESDCERRAGGDLYHRVSGKRVAAIMPVFTLGTPADMASFAQLATQYDLPLVVDAAAAIGARLQDKPIGALGASLTCLSFNGNKTVTSGGGGAIVGTDKRLLERAKHLTTTARTGLHYDHDEIGYNFRMTNVQAALGCAQMENLPYFLQRKQEIADRYNAELTDGGKTLPFPEPRGRQSTRWFSGVFLPEFDERQMLKLVGELRAEDLDARLFWKPAHLQKPYLKAAKTELPVSERIWAQILVLPCSTQLSDETQDYVLKTVKSRLDKRL